MSKKCFLKDGNFMFLIVSIGIIFYLLRVDIIKTIWFNCFLVLTVSNIRDFDNVVSEIRVYYMVFSSGIEKI